MKRIVSTLVLLSTLSFANMLNGIALTVNEDPITVFDIEEKMVSSKISKKNAVSSLIDEILFEQELFKQGVSVDIFDINNYLEKVAARNGMDLYTFKSIIRQKYSDYNAFEEETKAQISKDKLTTKLVRGNIKIATNEDLERYYENNKESFTTAQNINVMEYTTKNKKALIATKKNPMSLLEDVNKRSLKLSHSDLNQQLKYILGSTQEHKFTPIFTANKQFVMFYVVKKEGVTSLSFKEVKNKIFNVMMKKREENFLNDYFEKLKLTADIKIVR